MRGISNFSAGPGQLPQRVLEKAQKDMLNANESGISVMEMSHRSDAFKRIVEKAESDLRTLMKIPDNYKVLFLQGGASGQFAAVPLNLGPCGAYVISGLFSNKAYKEACNIMKSRGAYEHPWIVASSEDVDFTIIPEIERSRLYRFTDYVHICYNNTVYGTRFKEIPDTGNIPLVADMSSFILSEEIDVSKFGVIYAGAQKNIGPAGLTVVVVRGDLLGNACDETPSVLNWTIQSKSESLYNTPPCWSIYMAGLVFKDLINQGGIEVVEQRNMIKSSFLYNHIDESALFKGICHPSDRSNMNVTFTTGLKSLDDKFCAEANEAGLLGLKGHRSVGGIRASIYNAVSYQDVQRLVEFMNKFEKENC